MTSGAGAPAARWRWMHVLQSPHRLGFLFGMAVLAASGTWWAAVQLDRAGLGPRLPYAASPSLAHGAVMVFGFMPLFFGGFLFTAGPRWLELPPEPASPLVLPMATQAAGWMVWLLGIHLGAFLAGAGLLLALAGQATLAWRFAALLRASVAGDRLHARAIGWAHGVGCACIAALLAATWLQADGVAHALVRTGLWAFVVPVFLVAADRLIPFFSTEALPFAPWNRMHASLALLLALSLLEAFAPWLPWITDAAWPYVALGAVEAVAAALLLALAVAWGRAKRLSNRLLGIFHAGLLWLAVSFLLSAAGRLLGAAQEEAVLPLAGLHALTMGCLASLMLGMVSRVSAGHGGRPEVTDEWLWVLFWLLQVAALLRLLATVLPVQVLLTAAALLWAGIMLAWGIRHANWYGRPRYDRRA